MKRLLVWSLVAVAAVVFLALAPRVFPTPGESGTLPEGWGWLSLTPPVLAIGVALALRTVIPALFAGVWLGAYIVGGYEPLSASLRTLDRYIVGALTDESHIKIIVFSLMLGGMVGVMSRAGGTRGIVEALRGKATTRRRGQVATWGMGLLVFFDDYANTLVVGNTMRPITDRLRISREKLAFIVDSTAAPVACFALVSTWIGAEVGYIGDALDTDASRAYAVFLASIPYLFYPLLAVAFVALVGATGRDFGPMARAEARAARGALLGEGAAPLADWNSPHVETPDATPLRARNALVPIGFVIVATFVALWLTGRASLAESGAAAGTDPWWQVLFSVRDLGAVFGKGDSYNALLWAASGGCLVAIAMGLGQGIFRLEQGLLAWIEGVKAMLMAFIILTLAWAISAVCADLHTADYVVQLVSGTLDPRLVPLLVFLVAAGVAFATGSSWSTMGILYPLAIPVAVQLAAEAGMTGPAAERILLGSVAAVLSGSIFGDHCSPISDTTVMSSMASACDHVDHVRTQLPYALLVAGVGIGLGSLPSALGVPAWLCVLVGIGALWGILRAVGRPTPGVDSAG